MSRVFKISVADQGMGSLVTIIAGILSCTVSRSNESWLALFLLSIIYSADEKQNHE